MINKVDIDNEIAREIKKILGGEWPEIKCSYCGEKEGKGCHTYTAPYAGVYSINGSKFVKLKSGQLLTICKGQIMDKLKHKSVQLKVEKND